MNKLAKSAKAEPHAVNRRRFLAVLGSAGATAILTRPHLEAAQPERRNSGTAQVAITMDLEMARNFPHWEDTHWDYEKGNLTSEAKQYAVEAARRVKANGGVMHFFAVGQVFEQENVDWLKQIRDMGHKIGNHTYDHAYVLAKKPEEVQFKFQRAPWLVEGKQPAQIIRENIQLCTAAMQARLGVGPSGFRTPGGFADGLNGRTDIQQMLLDLGFKWVSCRYPQHPYGKPGERATKEVLDGIVAAQTAAQPFVYPTRLVDIPMSPISDIGAYRNARWKLDDFAKAVELALDWVIANGAVFDLLCHPSVSGPNDPEFRVIDMICERVKKAGPKARIVDLETVAETVKR